MNQYEVMYVIDAALDDGARVDLINRFSDLVKKNGGEVDRIDEWGKRRLAYAIDYKTEGYYVLVQFSSGSELPLELERNLKINDQVIRYQVIRLLERKVGIKPRAPRPQFTPAPAAAEAPAGESEAAPAATDAE